MKRRCFCGKSSKSFKCCEIAGKPTENGVYACNRKCDKPLHNCNHLCQKQCHEGVCEENCMEEVKVVCSCGKRSEKRPCCDVQKKKGYVASRPVQIVLECDESCRGPVTEQKEVIVSKKPAFQYYWIIVLIIAIIMGVFLTK